MSERGLTIEAPPPIHHRNSTNGVESVEPSFVTKYFFVVDAEGSKLLIFDTMPDDGDYSTYWPTTNEPEEFFAAVESLISNMEEAHGTTLVEPYEWIDAHGSIPQERPITMDAFREQRGGQRFVRLQTPYGAFIWDGIHGRQTAGFISDLNWSELGTFVQEQTENKVPAEVFNELLERFDGEIGRVVPYKLVEAWRVWINAQPEAFQNQVMGSIPQIYTKKELVKHLEQDDEIGRNVTRYFIEQEKVSAEVDGKEIPTDAQAIDLKIKGFYEDVRRLQPQSA